MSGSNENVVYGTGDGHIPQLLGRAVKEEGADGYRMQYEALQAILAAI